MDETCPLCTGEGGGGYRWSNSSCEGRRGQPPCQGRALRAIRCAPPRRGLPAFGGRGGARVHLFGHEKGLDAHDFAVQQLAELALRTNPRAPRRQRRRTRVRGAAAPGAAPGATGRRRDRPPGRHLRAPDLFLGGCCAVRSEHERPHDLFEPCGRVRRRGGRGQRRQFARTRGGPERARSLS
jgi:hypothetical protein